MSDGSSVIEHLKTLKNREATDSKLETAADRIYVRCIQRVQELAKSRLPPHRRVVTDEEDVAQDVMDSFFRGVQKGRYPDLDDQNDLWQVLIMLAERKAVDAIRRQTAEKVGGKVHIESLWESDDESSPEVVGRRIVPRYEPTPWFAAMVAEEFHRLIDLTEAVDQTQHQGKLKLRKIAMLCFEGHTAAEIADKLNCSERTVQRRLRVIRMTWDSTRTSDQGPGRDGTGIGTQERSKSREDSTN